MTWQFYERKKAIAHRGKHVGGPGNPDYVRGDTRGEVKNWNRPVGKTVIQNHFHNHGSTEFVSKSGFTQNAIDYVDRYQPNMNLFHKNKKVR